MEVRAKSSLDSKGFNSGVDQMEDRVESFKSQVAGAGVAMAGAFSIGAVGKKGLDMMVESVGKAFERETFATQFKIMFKDIDKAKAHIAELAEFAASTPFELPNLVNASRQLMMFSEGVMGGTNSLKLFGDAAAAAGQKDLGLVTYWVGRLYASLASGRPFIDSANALSRLGLMAPSTLKQMIKLEKAGTDNAQIWDVFATSLKRFEGGMNDMAKTGDGLMSTMKDNWSESLATFGKEFEGMAKDEIQAAIDKMRDLKKEGAIEGWAKTGSLAIKGLVAQWKYMDTVTGLGAMRKLVGKGLNLLYPSQAPGPAAGGGTGQLPALPGGEDPSVKAKRAADQKWAKAFDKDLERAFAQGLKDQSREEVAEAKRREAIDRELKQESDRNLKDLKNAMRSLEDIQKQEVPESIADRLAAIGGQLGGAMSPEARYAQKQQMVAEQTRDLVKDLPRDLARQLQGMGVLR